MLIVGFGDNDFGSTLRALGEYLLNQVIEESVLKSMEKNGDLANNLSIMFRNLLPLHQYRYDLYDSEYFNDSLYNQNEKYQTDEYYQIKPYMVYFTDDYPDRNNGETLVVDFNNCVVEVI